ncbi:MAG: DUF1772 domain-containing protein [Holophagales bacterium]|nr:DUF1772 domain-containing protein [Holophagales bacterium]
MSADMLLTVMLWAAAISSGLMAGVYLAFSTFIMAAFDRIPASHAVSAMNSINKVILRSLFMLLFFGSTLVSAFLVYSGFAMQNDSVSGLVLAAGLIYVIGMFISTAVFNVPRNDRLARVDPDSAEAQPAWEKYYKEWTFWNHMRTLASLVTFVLSIYALVTV